MRTVFIAKLVAAGIGAGALATSAASQAALPMQLTAATTAATPSSAACDDGAWVGPDGINVNGRPDSLDAGDRGATYIWHDQDGWHLRTTDPAGREGHYSGVIVPSAGVRFYDLTTVRLEKDDHVWIGEDGALHYSFATYSGIDGVDFKVSACAGDRANEALRFTVRRDGEDEDAARIVLGDSHRHPDSSTFYVHRSV
ncbi:MAG: hypothetical protein ACYDAY_02550 [Candidatus Dormibacteria bacterium]